MAGLDPAISPRPRTTVERSEHPVTGGWVYMLTNRRDGTLYTGVTADLPARLAQHRAGTGSTFVRRYNLHRLVFAERHEAITVAIQRETSLKRWPRAWKLTLIERMNPEWEDLSRFLV